jgi:hypothetical protein
MANLGHEFEHLLREASTRLIEDNTGRVPVWQVMAAVSWAQRYVRDGYDAFNMAPPPANEHVALIVGLAAQEIVKRHIS